jgi:hypothetical protein
VFGEVVGFGFGSGSGNSMPRTRNARTISPMTGQVRRYQGLWDFCGPCGGPGWPHAGCWPGGRPWAVLGLAPFLALLSPVPTFGRSWWWWWLVGHSQPPPCYWITPTLKRAGPPYVMHPSLGRIGTVGLRHRIRYLRRMRGAKPYLRRTRRTTIYHSLSAAS